MVIIYLIKKTKAPIFIGALVFCSLAVFGQDYYYKDITRGESITTDATNKLITSLNSYTRGAETSFVQGKVVILDNSKKEHTTLSFNIADALSIIDCVINENYFYITGVWIRDATNNYSSLFLAKLDSCFAVDWIKVLETDEPEGFQVDFPIPNIYFLDNHLYIQGQGTYRKNYFWLPEPRNVATSSIFKFNLDGQLINTIPLFTDYQIIKSYGIQQFDSTSLIQFSYGMHTRNLDQG